jgi:pimeloyl-ACP methyl ester carboxylesterase
MKAVNRAWARIKIFALISADSRLENVYRKINDFVVENHRVGVFLMKKQLLVLLLLSTLALARQADSTIAGYWEGAYLREGSVQLLKMNIENRDGQWRALLSVPDGGILDAQPRDWRYNSNQLSFAFIHGQTTLLVDAAAGEMRGVAISRDSTKTRVHLKRTLKPVEAKILREEVRFQSGTVTMAGTLMLPNTRGPHPAIIIVSGRGYGGRAGNSSDATRLAQRGVASLIFDGRGAGESGGDRMKTTAEERYHDVLAAIDLLAARKDIDAKQIGLWGISAGGWVIPIAAQRSGKVAFLMLDVGPAESLAEQQGHVVEYNMRWFAKEKFTEEEFKAAYAYQKKLVELSWQEASWKTFEPLVAKARQQRWLAYVDLPENLENGELDYFRRYKNFDNSAALRQTKIPVLAWYGERDYVVPPPENVTKLERLLKEAGNQDFKILVIPEADHGMTIPGGMRGEGDDWPARYYRWQRRATGLYETIYEWVLAHVKINAE